MRMKHFFLSFIFDIFLIFWPQIGNEKFKHKRFESNWEIYKNKKYFLSFEES